MLKQLMDFIFGTDKSKVLPEQKDGNQIAHSKRIVDNESVAEAIKNRRTETLSGGFVYRYPVTVGNTTFFHNNIQDAVNFIMSAKTKEEKEARSKLYHQVMERETKQMMDSLHKRIDSEVAEGK